MGEQRIKDLSMSLLDVMVIMSDRNPGAVTVMIEMMDKTDAIDPDAVLGGLGSIVSLDTHSIYGPRIWMFYKDVCKQNMNTMLGLLRAAQLGFLSENKLNHGIDYYGDGLDIPDLLAQVKKQLPKFVLGNNGSKR